MNKIYLLTIFAISVAFKPIVAQSKCPTTVQQQLEVLNRYWRGTNYNYPVLKERITLNSDVSLIKTHLSLVEEILRKRNPKNLTDEEKQNRIKCLDILHTYWKKGIFPKNTHHNVRTPYFIDDFGTACAVGQLIIATGHADLAKKISSENNYAYIADMNYPEVLVWGKENGFTIEELEWIQPTYACSNGPCMLGTYRNVSCYGAEDGCISPNPSAYGWPTPYTWTCPSYGNCCNLPAGSYTVIVTDGLNNNHYFYYTLTQPPLLVVSANPSNIGCNGANDGSASSTVIGGVPPYTYLWSNGQSTVNISGLSAGTYTINVTDSNNCSAFNTVTITQPLALSVSANTTSNELCYGGTNGSASSIIIGGTTPYTYSWSNGQTTPNISSLSARTYALTVHDSCGASVTASTTITQPAALQDNMASTCATCCNCKGSATDSIYGGSAPYTFLWSNGRTNDTIRGLPSGTYSCTVTDANGCVKTDTVWVSQGEHTSGSQTNVSCYGGNNGTATVTVAGNNSYTWAPVGGTGSTAHGLSAGSYTVTITNNDTAGCISSQVFNITQPIQLTVSVPGAPFITCGFNCDYATAIVTGGTAPYNYSWSPLIGFGNTVCVNDNNYGNGYYNVYVTDNNGCNATTQYYISGMQVAGYIETNVSCYGGSTGSAFVTGLYGSGVYSYSWAPNGGNAQNATGLSAGTYSCTVTDLVQTCILGYDVTITQPTALIISATTTSNEVCYGGSIGSASSAASGGTSPYTYFWSNSQTTPTISSLSAGIYTLNVTDHNGCTGSAIVSVTQPTALSISANITANVSCNGATNGSASSTVSGGTAPYTYRWSNTETTPTISSISAGTYTVIVTDNNGCTASATVSVTQPPILGVSASTTANVSCHGGTNGSALSTASGGTKSYTYSWSNSQTTQNITGISAGTYTLTVSDSCGASATASVTITQPTALSISANTTANVLCNGGTNGSASSTASGGTIPYTYLWSDSKTTSNISSLSAGTYTLNVTDNNGCTDSASITITQPPPLTASIGAVTNVLCNGGANGNITVVAGGGTTPYGYIWSPFGGTLATATGLNAGCYTVTVRDNNGCTATASACITQPTSLNVSANATTNVNCNDGINGSASSAVSGGTTPYTYLWSNSQTTPTISSLIAGTYTLNVTDNNGCSGSASISITQPTNLSASANTTANVLCNGESNGSASSTVSGGTKPYTYTWSNSATTANISSLNAGTYTLTVSDSCGASVTARTSITQPTTLILVADNYIASDTGCYGVAYVGASGGIGPYHYVWTPSGQTTDTIKGLCTGHYCCTVTDRNGCTDSACTNVSTGINNITYNSSRISIYPNPNNGAFTLESGAENGESIIEIYNALGQIICSRSLLLANGSKSEINISNQSAGVYFYRVSKLDGSLLGEGKVLIQK